jgi:hypothetical protein
MSLIVVAGRKRKVRVLGKWIKRSMAKHFQWVSKLDASPEERMRRWRESGQHHLTESDWVEKERNSPDSQRQLQAFVTAAEPLVEKYQKACSTQLCECLNSLKSGKASKRIAWQTSFTCRCSAAILDMNEKHGWRLLAYDALREKCGWPVLSQRARQVLERAFTETTNSERRRNPEVRKAANRQRLARHHKLERIFLLTGWGGSRD